MKPNYILVLLLLYIAALSGMTSYLDARRIAEPQWSVVVTSLIASSLIFWWYWADSTSRSYRRSPLLNVAIVAIAFFAVPYFCCAVERRGGVFKQSRKCSVSFCSWRALRSSDLYPLHWPANKLLVPTREPLAYVQTSARASALSGSRVFG